jgi:ABC-type multidrug transport system, ATPase component
VIAARLYAMIACRSVTKTFQDKAVLSDVSLEIGPGRILGLLGRNSAGKSTLIKILTGQLSRDSGDVYLLDQPIRRMSHALRQMIGVLPEELGLFDDLTVLEHLDLSAKVYGLPKAVRSQRLHELLTVLDLDDGRHTPARNCSHGMKKKTALALALLHNPKVIFLDEPFEGIDPVAAESIRKLLLTMARKGSTILLTAHTFALLEGLADDVAILHDGKIAYRSQYDCQMSELKRIFFSIVGEPNHGELEWLGS